MDVNAPTSHQRISRWPHTVATVLVCAPFPVIWVGGLVTTYDAGMAVPDWPSTYGYNLFLYPVATWLGAPWDLFIEHGHRLLASAVGLITIAFVAVTWKFDDRRWMRWFSLVCLALVLLQGLVGGLRVVLDENVLARLHGCLGPVFFVSCVAGAVFTSKWWYRSSQAMMPKLNPLTPSAVVRTSWILLVATYLQLVLGAHLRHPSPTWSPRFFQVFVLAHLLLAAVIAVHALMLVWQTRASWIPKKLRYPVLFLVACVSGQLLLGAGAWRVKYYWPTWLPQPAFLEGYTVTAESMEQTLTVTAHVAMGSLILAICTMIALRATRLFAESRPSVAGAVSTGFVLEAVL